MITDDDDDDDDGDDGILYLISIKQGTIEKHMHTWQPVQGSTSPIRAAEFFVFSAMACFLY